MKHFKDISFWCIVLGVVVIMVVHHILSHKSDIIEGQQNDTVKCGSTEDEETGNPCCDYDLWYEKNEENEKCKCPATMRNGTETDGIFTTDSNGIQYGRVDDHVEGTELASDPRCSNASLTTDKPTSCDKNNRFVDETSINNSTHFRCLTPTEVDDNIIALARSLGIDVNNADAVAAAAGSPSTLLSITGDIETRRAIIDKYDIDITGKTGEDINLAIEDEEALRSKYCLDVNASASTLIDKKITARERLSLSETASEGEYDEALNAHAKNCTYFNLNDEFDDCSNFSCSIDGEGGVNAAGATLDVIDSLAMNLSENPCCPHESNPIPNDGCISTLVADGKEEFWEYTYDTDGKRTNAGPYCRFFAESNPCAAEDSDVATCEFKQGGHCTETPADCETRIKEKLRVKCVDENLITDQNCPTLSDCESACTWDKMNDAKNARLAVEAEAERGEINSNIAELNTFLEENPSYVVSDGDLSSYPFSEIDECREEDLTASPAVEKETNEVCEQRRLDTISTINELCRSQVPPQNTQGSDALIQCEESDIAGLYEFTSHTFTNCDSFGRTGPGYTACINAYGGGVGRAGWWRNTEYFQVPVAGIQAWKCPESGPYLVTGAGAEGGHNYQGGTTIHGRGGRGAVLSATFMLTKGQWYWILIGQKGMDGVHDAAGGAGGGGTFFVKVPRHNGQDGIINITNNTSITNNDLLLAAGGGGGAGGLNSWGERTKGQTGWWNKNRPIPTWRAPTQWTTMGGSGGDNTPDGGYGSGGGGGFIGNGEVMGVPGGGGTGGKSFKEGGEGGEGHVYEPFPHGGFGGGGAPSYHAGGGGGGSYGGNAGDGTCADADHGPRAPGCGGGCLLQNFVTNSDTAYGNGSPDNLTNEGHGYITIELQTDS